jgi:CBS-domain-containing membrane protein
MRVRDIMTTTVVTATISTSFQELVDLMIRHGVSGIPVLDGDGRPVGVVSEADIIAKEAYRSFLFRPPDRSLGQQENTWAAKSRGLRAGDLMTVPVRTVRPDDLVRMAAARMVATGVNRFPVVDDTGRLVGIVSRNDVLRIFHRSDNEIRLAVDAALADPLLVPEGHTITATVDDGVVTLVGSVRLASHVRIVDHTIHDVLGVIDVVNHLEVAGSPTVPAGVAEA